MAFVCHRGAECVLGCFFAAYHYVDCAVSIADFRANSLAVGKAAVRFQFRCDCELAEIPFKSGNTDAGNDIGVAVYGGVGACVYFAE